MDRHWSLEQIDDISGSRVVAGASLSLPTILTGRSVAAPLELPGSGPQGQMQHHLRSKRPKTKGKIEISHSVKERPKQADERSRLGEWGGRHARGSGTRVPARACRQGSEAACRGKSHHDSGSVFKAEVGLLQGYPLETLAPKWGKQLAGHADVTDAL
ncbi:hypothetical protein [Atopobium sp. oral taxon 416]|uniref:hypothetical protein n=1 Tax=Atopobium sp. oral taxon 416 TaxID=712157 RepID=UPI001BAC8E62|nr:hypothetical protein [Atopobium sp. oral taxon 416]QUC02170.1 hypothetical protein J4859_08880 [Atopobium sp. oral taxon 416]